MPESGIDHDVREIIAVTDEESAAIAAADAPRYFAVLAEDAVFMPPNSPERTGNDLRQWLAEFLENVTIEWHSYTHGETIVSGEVAYHTYTCSWTATPKSNPQPVLLYFKGLHILRRQPGGSWKILREIWNTSPAA